MPAALFQSFFFVHELGGELYVQLSDDSDEAASLLHGQSRGLFAGNVGELATPTDSAQPVPELLERDSRYVLSLPVEGSQEPASLPPAGLPNRWEIYSGAALVCTAELGPLMQISLSVPHFGQVEGWNTDPETGPAKNPQTRVDLFGQGAIHVMFKAKGCKVAAGQFLNGDALWARPVSCRKPVVTDFLHTPPDGVADELVKRSSAMPAWAELSGKVKRLYAEDPAQPGEIPSDRRVDYGVLVHGPSAIQEILVVRLGMGETECGHGPGETYLTHVWSRTGQAPWMLALSHLEDPEAGAVGLQLLLWGDFNGDGVWEAVLRTGPFRDERVLFQLDSFGLGRPIRRTYMNFNDCPC